jgi:hypothetical protein
MFCIESRWKFLLQLLKDFFHKRFPSSSTISLQYLFFPILSCTIIYEKTYEKLKEDENFIQQYRWNKFFNCGNLTCIPSWCRKKCITFIIMEHEIVQVYLIYFLISFHIMYMNHTWHSVKIRDSCEH